MRNDSLVWVWVMYVWEVVVYGEGWVKFGLVDVWLLVVI